MAALDRPVMPLHVTVNLLRAVLASGRLSKEQTAYANQISRSYMERGHQGLSNVQIRWAMNIVRSAEG